MSNNPVSSTEESLVAVSGPPDAAAGTPKPSLKETLEIASKSLIGLAGLCYVLGLMVVTLHLRRYGLNSLSLSQLHYVTAGVWVLLPGVVGVFYCIFVKVFYETAVEQRHEQLLKEQRSSEQRDSEPPPVTKDEGQTDGGDTSGSKSESNLERLRQRVRAIRTNPKVRAIFLAVVIPAAFFAAVVGGVSEKFHIQLSWRSWLVIPALGTLVFGAAFVVILAVFTGQAKLGDKNFMAMMAFAAIGAALFLFYLSYFSVYTYEEIPWSTGGGRPSQVQLVVPDDEKAFLQSTGIKFGSVANQTESLRLLLVTETEYIIIMPDGKAISIPASSVKSVVYEK